MNPQRWISVAAFSLLIPHSTAQAKTAQKTSARCGPLAEQTLRCSRFGFTYKVPFGWVDRTADMEADSQPSPTANSDHGTSAQPDKDAQQRPPSSGGAETLLAVFERPPTAPGETINSAVVIAAEPLVNYHGIKNAGEYFGAISELAEQRGFKALSDPYSFSVGSKQVVRGDFSKERNKLTMYQTSLATIEKGYIVSFTFIAGSEDEVSDLMDNLTFGSHSGSHAGSKQ